MKIYSLNKISTSFKNFTLIFNIRSGTQMIKTFHFIFIIVIILFNLVYAGETGKLSGHVSDRTTKEALIGANIVIISRWESGVERKISNLLGSVTDKDGDYYILNIPPGIYNVRASFIGYKQEIVTKVSVDVDKTTAVDFTLVSEAIQSGEILITAYNPKKVEPDVTSTKSVYNISDIQSTAGISSISDVLELQADVIDDHFRGGRIGQSSYLIGGAPIVNPLSNQRSFSPMVTGLQQVEVYTSGFSAEYGNAQSGVVNMIPREGGETWETRLESSTVPPYYKTYNGSVYSESNLPFFNILNSDLTAWFANDPSIGKPLFTVPASIGAFNPLNLKDSLALCRLNQVMWLQSIRKVGLKYNNRFDYRLDFSTGGPIASGLKFFLAARQEVINPLIPTANPDLERQVITNITYDLNPYNKFKIDFILDTQFHNTLDGGGWQDWLFNPTLSVTKDEQTTKHYGIEWKHLFSYSTYVDLKFNLLNVLTKQSIELILDDQYSELYTKKLQWPDYTSAAQFATQKLQGTRGDQTLSSYDIQGSLNSQVNKFNLLKAGLQFTYYDLNVNREQSITSASTIQEVKFNNYPYEGALYLQNKMEYLGFIANIGLRLDLYDMNTDYYTDTYSPLRNPLRTSESGNDYYDKSRALRAHTKLFTKLQPRIGISFPLSETTVFHLNYGTFTQRPSFTQIFYNQVSHFGDIQFLGNPLLKPENTRAYDIGLVNAFPGIRVELSAYYKDITNLVQVSQYEDIKTTKYQTYTNRDYSDVKGFIINIDKTDGYFQGYIRYNFESAKGKNSTFLVSPVTYSEDPSTEKLADPRDVYLDYDRTHKAIANFRFATEKDDGFRIGKFYPLGNISVSVSMRVYSGRPYTFDASGQGLQYNMRAPWEYDLRMRIEKSVRFGHTDVLFYAEGFNLLNLPVYNYSVVFNDPNNTFNRDKYQKIADAERNHKKIEDPYEADIRWYDFWKPYTTDQSIRIYSNQPRYFRFGARFKF
jgi:outer membrane receptor protein involved in Fe transport